jgi:formate dehydrogenase maturation protein FdhE
MSGVSDTDRSDEEYRVGPGRPPKEFQFKPGQSGNPKGAKRKAPSIATDLKELFQHALSKTVKLRQGEKEQIVTKAAAGIEQLVNQFAKGDRHARRDLMVLADKLGVDLAAGQDKALEATPDLTKLSDEELQQWRKLLIKAMTGETIEG